MIYYLLLTVCFTRFVGACQVQMLPQPYMTEKECIEDGLANVAKGESGDAAEVRSYWCLVRSAIK